MPSQDFWSEWLAFRNQNCSCTLVCVRILIGKKKTRKSLFLILFFALVAIPGLNIPIAFAGVPSVLSVEGWASGTDTILNITVSHSPFTSSHYVNKVEVDVDGTVDEINLPSQSTVTFVVQYNMGEVTGTPTVQTRAFCNIDGWSSWSEPVVVPEFSWMHVLLILIVVPIAILFLRSKVYGQKDNNV